MLKFDGFKVGQVIKAYDFAPVPDKPDRFVVGTIIMVRDFGFRAYTVQVIQDTLFDDFSDGQRKYVDVPMYLDRDFANRVSLVTN